MILYTHTDLDGVFSAALISIVEQVDEFRFVDPGTVQSGRIPFTKNDIIADLPFDRRCGMWFDHHESSRPREGLKFEGAWGAAPSCARVIYGHYENPYLEKFAKGLGEVDNIDSGKVPIGQAESPSGWFLLSNTLETEAPKKEDDGYRRHVINLIQKNPEIETILEDEWVAERSANVKQELETFRRMLLENTKMVGRVAFSDLRLAKGFPRGNNYLVYSLFPGAVTSVRLMPVDEEDGTVKLSVGHNVYGKKSEFDVGAAMKKIGGGGHRPVGGATVKAEETEEIAKRLIDELNRWEGAHP
ncbi:TPA: hypothetical protein HA225_01850 [Candidatus Micrarchaeota archaeon]|nr:hypothetical protein [Candidatus Micrarchaeota archaeon]HIH29978.1 hypothetical protein [Candidatus Micrarchaeota archaeon]